MDNFFDWSDDAIAPLKPAKTAQSAALADEVKEYLDAGGHLEWVPYNPIPEMVGAVSTMKRKWPTEEGATKATPTE